MQKEAKTKNKKKGALSEIAERPIAFAVGFFSIFCHCVCLF